jgi:hypothetical protein
LSDPVPTVPVAEARGLSRFVPCLLRRHGWSILALILIGVIGWFYVGLIDTEIIGFTHDDGVYIIAGKALNLGQGFTLLHVVGHPPQIKYPIVFPLILSLVWRLNPNFPENLQWMNHVTIAFGLASFWLLFRLLRQMAGFPAWLALLVIALTASGFFFMYFFSTVMSEAPYLFFSLLTLWVFFRRHAREERFSIRSILLLVLLSVITFHTRVFGVAMMAAIGSWLLLNRQWRNALVYGIGSLLLGLIPWAWWIKTKTPPLNDLTYPLVNAYSNYGLEFVHNFRSMDYLNSLGAVLLSFMYRLLEDMVPLIPDFFQIYPALQKDLHWVVSVEIVTIAATYLLCGYYILQGISAIRKSCSQQSYTPTVFSVPALYVFFYSLVAILWNYQDQMTRFITVITPLFWMYFFKPMVPALKRLQPRWSKSNLKAACLLGVVVVSATIGLWPAVNSYRVVHTARSQHWVDSGKYRGLWQEYQHAFAYIKRSLPADAPLSVASDVVFHLYTGRPTFYTFYASLYRVRGKYTRDSVPKLMRSLDHHGVKYLVAEPHMQMRTVRHPVNEVAAMLLKAYPERFERIYTTPQRMISIYRILPLPSKP